MIQRAKRFLAGALSAVIATITVGGGITLLFFGGVIISIGVVILMVIAIGGLIGLAIYYTITEPDKSTRESVEDFIKAQTKRGS